MFKRIWYKKLKSGKKYICYEFSITIFSVMFRVSLVTLGGLENIDLRIGLTKGFE